MNEVIRYDGEGNLYATEVVQFFKLGRNEVFTRIVNVYMIIINGVDPRMIANNLTPFRPVHPGELLKDELEYREITQDDFSEQIGIKCSYINEVLNCKRPVSPELSILVEAALGIEADMLIRMQTSYDMQVARKDKNLINKFNKIRSAEVFLYTPEERYNLV